jgi:hypothetical protein
MATYSLTQQPYSIQNIGYSDQSGGGGANYQQSSLYSFLDPTAPVFFGNAASITVNLFGGQWYINMFDTNGSFIIFFMVNRLDYSDADHLVFSDGNFEYVIYDGPINYAAPVSIPDDSSIPGDYQPGLANAAPTDIALSNVNVAENSANGTVVGALTDTDPDAGDTAAFTLTDDAGGRFAVSGSNLVVADGALLDFESNTSHSVTVRVTDSGGLTFDKIFAIGITNANETPTDIALSSGSVAENSANGTIVGALSDTDPDAGDTAAFTLTDDAGGRFAVSGTNLVVANGALLNFESNTSHSVTVRVTDGGGLTFDKVFAIGVTNANEAPTNIALSNASVAENSANGTIVGALSDTDPDAGDTAAFTLVGNAGGRFAISGTNLVVANGALLDFESNTSHSVTVRVTDAGGLTFDKAFNVAVTDVSEANPSPSLHWTASVGIPGYPPGWLPQGIGDFNADGTDDVAWYNASTNSVDIWKLSNGQWAGSSNAGSHPPGYQPAGFGDYNHDGTDDILWFNPTTRDVDLWNISNGQWAGSANIGTHPAGWAPSLSGDFNGDGTSDVSWHNPTTNAIDIWKISNGQWAGSVDVGAHPAGYQPVLAGDFNGDGTSDIAWFNPANGQVDIWKMANGQWAGSVNVGPHPAGWQPLGAADFNTDGTSDIAWYNPATNKIDIWLMKNGQWSASVDVGAHPAGAVAVGVGDFDHNGVSDIMWRDTTTGFIDNWMLAYS